jgi:hypothetical protein
MPEPVQIERLEAVGDPEAVRARLRDWRRPVVFAEARDPAFERFFAAWTPERYAELVGEHVSHARYYPPGERGPGSDVRPMPFRDVFEEVSKPAGAGNFSCRLAIKDAEHRTFVQPLFDDVATLCGALASTSWGGHSFDTVWFGGTGTVTPLHYDPVSRLHGAFRGRKFFTLYPPDRRHLKLLEVLPARTPMRNYSRIGLGPLDPAAFAGLADAAPVEAELGPGDVLYIPPCWWHHVTIREPFTVTSSVAYFPSEIYRSWAYWRLKVGELLGRAA